MPSVAQDEYTDAGAVGSGPGAAAAATATQAVHGSWWENFTKVFWRETGKGPMFLERTYRLEKALASPKPAAASPASPADARKPTAVPDALDMPPLMAEELGTRTTLIGLLLALLLLYVSVAYFDLLVTLRLLCDNPAMLAEATSVAVLGLRLGAPAALLTAARCFLVNAWRGAAAALVAAVAWEQLRAVAVSRAWVA